MTKTGRSSKRQNGEPTAICYFCFVLYSKIQCSEEKNNRDCFVIRSFFRNFVALNIQTTMKKQIFTLCLVACSMTAAQAQTIDTLLNKVSTQPFTFSTQVPDGNYRVTVTLGNK